MIFFYIDSLLKAKRNNDQNEQYLFPTPENSRDEMSHTPIQQRMLRELRNLQQAEKLNPQDEIESRRKFLSASTGRTQCYNSMKSNKLRLFWWNSMISLPTIDLTLA